MTIKSYTIIILTGQYKRSVGNVSKEIIIDAAEKLFSNKGYYQTSMQDIADEAQVAKGTLYYHLN